MASKIDNIEVIETLLKTKYQTKRQASVGQLYAIVFIVFTALSYIAWNS